MSRRSVYMPGHSHSRTRGSRVARMVDQVATTDTSKYVDNTMKDSFIDNFFVTSFKILIFLELLWRLFRLPTATPQSGETRAARGTCKGHVTHIMFSFKQLQPARSARNGGEIPDLCQEDGVSGK